MVSSLSKLRGWLPVSMVFINVIITGYLLYSQHRKGTVPADEIFLHRPKRGAIGSTPVFDKVDDTTPFNMTFVYLLQPEKVATGAEVLVLVFTLPSQTQLREQIRNSWANSSELGPEVRVEFLMGISAEAFRMSELAFEQKKFDDLVLVNFADAYYNLAVKTLVALDYKQRVYPKTRCLVKSDVDNVLLLRNYQRLCAGAIAPSIIGKCNVKRTVFRNKKKWAVPEHVYPQKLFPYYCSTGTYVFVGSSLPKDLSDAAFNSKFRVSQNLRRLPEDVVFTGLLPELVGVRRLHVGGMSFNSDPEMLCRNNSTYTYSIHMPGRRSHIANYRRLLKLEGTPCSSKFKK